MSKKVAYRVGDDGGRATWKKTSGYYKRSLAETHMFRFKTILGDKFIQPNL